MFNRPDSRFFKREHIDETYRYFDRYGGGTVIVARFVPFVRTYAAVAAGRRPDALPAVRRLRPGRRAAWGVGVTMLGFALGNIEFVKTNIELLLAGSSCCR